MPAPDASSMLAVARKASAPTPPPITSPPRRCPNRRRTMGPATMTPKNRKMARSVQSAPGDARFVPSCGSGSGSDSPAMRAPICATAACSPPAKSFSRKRGFIAPSMMRAAAMSGIAPSSALATSMRMRRSSLATMTSTPSPTSRRPIFQALPTRLAKAAMSSGAVVGTISTTTCEPCCCSMAASCVSSDWRCASLSVAVWSITRAVSAGTARSGWAAAGRAPATTRKIAASACQTSARGIFYLEKSTAGGVLICASFCTVKLGLGS